MGVQDFVLLLLKLVKPFSLMLSLRFLLIVSTNSLIQFWCLDPLTRDRLIFFMTDPKVLRITYRFFAGRQKIKGGKLHLLKKEDVQKLFEIINHKKKWDWNDFKL